MADFGDEIYQRMLQMSISTMDKVINGVVQFVMNQKRKDQKPLTKDDIADILDQQIGQLKDDGLFDLSSLVANGTALDAEQAMTTNVRELNASTIEETLATYADKAIKSWESENGEPISDDLANAIKGSCEDLGSRLTNRCEAFSQMMTLRGYPNRMLESTDGQNIMFQVTDVRGDDARFEAAYLETLNDIFDMERSCDFELSPDLAAEMREIANANPDYSYVAPALLGQSNGAITAPSTFQAMYEALAATAAAQQLGGDGEAITMTREDFETLRDAGAIKEIDTHSSNVDPEQEHVHELSPAQFNTGRKNQKNQSEKADRSDTPALSTGNTMPPNPEVLATGDDSSTSRMSDNENSLGNMARGEEPMSADAVECAKLSSMKAGSSGKVTLYVSSQNAEGLTRAMKSHGINPMSKENISSLVPKRQGSTFDVRMREAQRQAWNQSREQGRDHADRQDRSK